MATFTEIEVVELAAVSAKRLRAWVRKGWVRPEAKGGAPVFSDVDVARVQLLKQLCDELAIEEESVEVVLSLLDQVHGLRSELKALTQALEAQPEPVQIEVTRVYRELRFGRGE